MTIAAGSRANASDVLNAILASVALFDITTYGAIPGGAFDIGPAVQQAINAANAAGGGIVRFPAGLWLWNNQSVIQFGCVHLIGAGWSETVNSGTRILTTSTAVSPLLIAGRPAAGSSVRMMSFQQAQPAPAPGWAPTVYPPTIDIESVSGTVALDDLFFYNCYDAIRCVNSGRLEIGTIKGQVLHCGLYINGSYDVPHVGAIRFWPYWTLGASDAGSMAVAAWILANGTAIRTYRCDGFQASRIFAFGYYAGFRLSYATTSSPDNIPFAGGTTIAQIGSLYPDGCTYGVMFDGPGGSMHIDSLYTGNENLDGTPITNGTAIYFHDTGCTLSVGNAKLFFSGGPLINFDNANGANVLMIANAEFIDFDITSGVDAIQSVNSFYPNKIALANPPHIALNNGASLINLCNAWFYCPFDTPQFITPMTGATVTIGGARRFFAIAPVGTLASLAVVLPASDEPNSERVVYASQAITSITWSAGGTPIVAFPTSLTAGQMVRFKFLSSSITEEAGNAWYAMT